MGRRWVCLNLSYSLHLHTGLIMNDCSHSTILYMSVAENANKPKTRGSKLFLA